MGGSRRAAGERQEAVRGCDTAQAALKSNGRPRRLQRLDRPNQKPRIGPMEKAGDEPITDWILPAEAWRLLVERWGDRNVCEELARKGLAEGGPWCCRRVDGGAKKN